MEIFWKLKNRLQIQIYIYKTTVENYQCIKIKSEVVHEEDKSLIF